MKLIVFVITIMLCISCLNKPDDITDKINSPTDISISDHLIADTIIYDVVIKSSNPIDDWENQRLQYVNHSAFIDSLFNLVYNKKIIAYDVFENKPLSVSQVKSIEEQDDYDRNRIGKIQFAEKWYFDPSSNKLKKQILSIALGYETFNEMGEVRAYKPVFKLYLN